MKNYSSRTIAIIILVSFLAGGIPVYATSSIHPNILGFIRDLFDSNIPDYLEDINNQTEAIVDEKTDRIIDYIDFRMEEAYQSIDIHIQTETSRINEELDKYIDKIINELDQIIDMEEDRIREIVTDYVNNTILVLENDLYDQIYDKLYQHLEEKVEN
ncbi:MAG: hypothetical protein GX306_00930 [Clostridiales bacterium]|nr:hypothetical protein [Clostridiales bacterium]